MGSTKLAEATASRAGAKAKVERAMARVARPDAPDLPVGVGVLGALGLQHTAISLVLPEQRPLALPLGSSGHVGCRTLSISIGLPGNSSRGPLGSSRPGQDCYCDRAVEDAPWVAVATAGAWAIGAAGSRVIGAAATATVLVLGQPGNGFRHYDVL